MNAAKFSAEGLYEILSDFRSEVKTELASIREEVGSLKETRSELRGRDKVFGLIGGALSGGIVGWLFNLGKNS